VARPVAFILKGYPRLSETFIAQEILGLEKSGLDIRIYSMRPPRESQRHPINDEIRARVTYLPERLRDEPGRVLRAFFRCMTKPGLARALHILRADMISAPSLDRLRRFGQALVLAHEIDEDIRHIHAHFLHTPASVGQYGAALTNLPWSCSAHARDIWTISNLEIQTKLEDMEWLVTCTQSGAAHLSALASERDKVELVYHGLDLTRFPSPPKRHSHDGSDPDNPVQLLSVGRAVEKKGFDTLLEALGKLPPALHWRWTHIGEGELLNELRQQVKQLKLSKRITWLGARTQRDVIAQYRSADLFVLPCRIARDGDRDGLPNVLVEAQTQALACLSSDISAIPELIEDGITGRLVKPDDPVLLRDALEQLIGDPQLRKRLGNAGSNNVVQNFSHQAGLAQLTRKFGLRSAKQVT